MKFEKNAWWSQMLAWSPTGEVARGELDACRLAVEQHDRGEAVLAELELRRACERWPESGVLHELLGSVRLISGDVRGAIEALEQALLRAGKRSYLINLLALAWLMQGEEERARAGFSDAAALDPEYADAQANAGWLRFATGLVAESGAYLRRWLELVTREADGSLRGDLPAQRRSLPGVTVCCIDCAYHDLAIHALRRTLTQCEFSAAYFFTDRDLRVEGVDVIRITPLRSSAEYSNFVVHELGKFIKTDFVLIIQYDGFVLNGQAWDDAFFDYDYIGAKIYRKDGYVVGNGGFTLRSAKLLKALRASPFSQYDAASSPWSEDLAICIDFRERLEREHGIRFAPGELADRFAVEASMPAAETFGFHNVVQLASLVDKDFAVGSRPGDRTMPIKLRAMTPFGPFAVETHVTLGGGADLDRLIAATDRQIPHR